MDMQLSVEKLKQQRDTRAWTQSHLAEVSDISLRTVQRIEKSGIASQESAQAICAAYEITVEQLFENPIDSDSQKVVEPSPTSRKAKFNPKFLIPAIVTLGMAVSFKFNSNSNEAVWLWKNEPVLGISFGIVSIALWGLLFYKSGLRKNVKT
jgi:DNA-binding XRE family transcriptional regulator